MKRLSLALLTLIFAASALPQEPTAPPIPNPAHANTPPLAPAVPSSSSAAPIPKTTAQTQPVPAPAFDPAAAAREWLDSIPADQKAKSDAYFEGGYWLILWDFLVSALIAILLLETRTSARIRGGDAKQPRAISVLPNGVRDVPSASLGWPASPCGPRGAR